MNALLKTLSLAWLVVALITAPLQATASALVPHDGGGCPMPAHQQTASGHHHQSTPGSGEHAAGHCKQCVDNGCDNGGCQNTGCCTAHLQLSIISALSTYDSRTPAAFIPARAENSDSLPPQPPYRPPV